MFAKLTSRTNALRLLAIGVVLILFVYIAIFFEPDGGRSGIFLLPVMVTTVRLFLVAWPLIILAIVLYAIRSRSLPKTGLLIGGAALLALPLLLDFPTPGILREYVESLPTQNHMYHLAEDILPYCPDTFDPKTYSCSSHVYLYECGMFGFFCKVASPDLIIHHESPLQLRAKGDKIQIIADQNTIAYTYPS